MTPNWYAILTTAIDTGINYGWNRAHKHTDTPDEADVKEAIYNAVVSELCEVVNFNDDHLHDD